MKNITLRDMMESDLPVLYEQQCDPLAVEMAAFPPKNEEKFMAVWKKAIQDRNIIKKTVLDGSEVAGYVVCWEKEDRSLMGYWFGSSFWGRGIGSYAVSEFVSRLKIRPVYAYVAKKNRGSIRILEKCGFVVTDVKGSQSIIGDDGVKELIYKLS